MVRIHHCCKWLLTDEQANWVRSSIGICKTYPHLFRFIEDLNEKDRSILEGFSMSSIRGGLNRSNFEVQSNTLTQLGLRSWYRDNAIDGLSSRRCRNPSRWSFSYKLLACPRSLLNVIITLHLTQMIAIAAVTNTTWNKLNFDRLINLIDRRLDRACCSAYFSYFAVRKTKQFIQRFFSLAIAIQRGLPIYYVPFTRFFASLKGKERTKPKASKQIGLTEVVGYDEFGIPIFVDENFSDSNEALFDSYDSDSYVEQDTQDSYSW